MSAPRKHPFANVAAPAGAVLGREYRPARAVFWTGAGCAVLFLIAAVGGVFVWAGVALGDDPNVRRLYAAGGVFFVGFAAHLLLTRPPKPKSPDQRVQSPP
jgi:hypothetical protein